jgi:threonyl-tRNA synthetase
VYDRLLEEDIRGHIDTRDEKIGRKIRDAEVQKIPYMIIVGEKEQDNNIIAVRKHGIGDMGNLTVDLFISNFKSMVEDILSKK